MLLNYLKLSLRLLVRNPFFTFINVLGLSVGFAAFFILWQYSTTELKSDQYHKDFERIFRVGTYWRWPAENSKWGLVTFGGIRPLQAIAIVNDFPQVESCVRILMQPEFEQDLVGHESRVVISVNNDDQNKESFRETHIIYADPGLFTLFNIPLVSGAKETVLKAPNSVVLSEHTARRYFGDKDPIGQMLVVNEAVPLTVTGVYKDLPHNTHLNFDLAISMTGIADSKWQDLSYLMTTVYLKLTKGTVLADFENELGKHQKEYWAKEFQMFPASKADMFLQPLKDVAFSTQYDRDYLHPKSRSTLLLFQGVSVLILSLAWVNYINLMVADMTRRMKDVATRKMSGAITWDFIRQFLVESTLVTVLATAFAFTLMQLIRQPAEVFFKIYVTPLTAITSITWLIFVIAIIAGILVTGTYPILMSVAHSPRTLFVISKGFKKKRIQSILTTVQYVVALILISCSFVIYLQLNFVLNKDLGIQKNEIIIVDGPVVKSSFYNKDFEYFMNEVRSIQGVQAATYSASVIGDDNPFFVWLKTPAMENFADANINGGVDESFIPFYRIKLIAGRNFMPSEKEDVIIIGRFTTQRLGYESPEQAIGDKIIFDIVRKKPMEVIGVIEDYRVKPLINLGITSTQNETGLGVCMLYKNKALEWYTPEKVSIKMEMSEIDETIGRIRKLYDEVFEGNFFNWYFLDDHVNKAYQDDKVTRNQIALFTVLAIGISCLGLLGMVTSLVKEKTKEIGIRKVLGANIQQSGGALLKAVFRHIVIAILIAIPLAYYLMNEYLKRYLEKIDLQWWHFVLPVTLMILIMFATVVSILLKAVRTNPVEALKYE